MKNTAGLVLAAGAEGDGTAWHLPVDSVAILQREPTPATRA